MVLIAMVIGYARFSKVDQQPKLQLDACQDASSKRVHCDKVTGDRETCFQLGLVLEALWERDGFVMLVPARLGCNLAHRFQIGAESRTDEIEPCSFYVGIGAMTATAKRGGRSSPFHDPPTVELAKSLLREASLTKLGTAAQVQVHVATPYRRFSEDGREVFWDPHVSSEVADETGARVA